MRHFAIITLLALVVSGCSQPTTTESTAVNPGNTAVNPDNTGVNARDRNESAKTPIDQNENQTDIDITANIRKQVVATKMSVNAQNVKIITQDGKVTLRGPVKSAEEKQQIESIANKIAGADRVISQLEVE